MTVKVRDEPSFILPHSADDTASDLEQPKKKKYRKDKRELESVLLNK